MKFNSRKILVSCAVLASIAITTEVGTGTWTRAALAESDPMARHQEQIGIGVRYPGDVAFKEGTIRLSGPDKGPYVERCTWHFNTGVSKGFGLTQTCVRYTLENTK